MPRVVARANEPPVAGRGPSLGDAVPLMGDTMHVQERAAVVRVTDDLASRIDVRAGEAQLLGPIIEAVIDQLRAKASNER
jgi:hypothetical protein